MSRDSYAPKRKARRVEFSSGIPVHIVGLDGSWRRDCLMLDVVFGGAKLVIDPAQGEVNAEEFLLMLSTTGPAHRRCELVWSNGEQLGVRFLDSTSLSPKTKFLGRGMTR